MKKMTLALLLIAAFCLFAVSPVMAYTYTTVTDPYKPSGNVTAKYTFGVAGKNVVSFPTATYKPSIAPTLDKTFTAPTYTPSSAKTLTTVFTVPAMSTLTTSIGGKYTVVKAPWE